MKLNGVKPVKTKSVKNSETTSNLTVIDALNDSESRFQAIVSNIPGLVFQLQMTQSQQYKFIYLSEGCDALLGMSPEELAEDPGEFFAIMNAFDKSQLKQKMLDTAHSGLRLDWEGRVWIDGWQDTKWINMRATTRKLENGDVQWDGIMFNITQSKREKQEIEQSRRDLQQLSAHMNHIKEQERISIAREIHDDLGGNLTAIKMGLNSITQQITAGQTVTEEQTQMLVSIVNRTFEAVHRISGNLRPNILDLGIVDAVEWQLKQFKKQVNVDVKFIVNKSEIAIDTDRAMELFRICQEALSNIAKYAQASLVCVELKEENEQLYLSIEDNGIGIKDADKIKLNAFGLRGMEERVIALNGHLSIGQASYGVGTKISVNVPI
jgi:two-component system, NarL family, sensor histidine kinase UhpB